VLRTAVFEQVIGIGNSIPTYFRSSTRSRLCAPGRRSFRKCWFQSTKSTGPI